MNAAQLLPFVFMGVLGALVGYGIASVCYRIYQSYRRLRAWLREGIRYQLHSWLIKLIAHRLRYQIKDK